MMGRRFIGGAVGIAAIVVGYFTATNGYAGHDDPTGTFCQAMLKQNHASVEAMEKLEAEQADWSVVSARMVESAADLRAIDSTDVRVDVATAARTLANSISAAATETDESKFDAVDTAYTAALESMAKTCNNATGENVGVDKG